MSYTNIIAGTLPVAGEVMGNFNSTMKSIIINKWNTTETFEDPGVYADILDTDSADTSTNWTYDATNDLYENDQTSAAILEFQTLLSSPQKDALETGDNTVFLYVDYTPTGDETSGIISNPGFETAGGGGADVFASWTETASTGTFTQSALNVTEGTVSALWNATSSSGTDTGTLVQASVDCTKVNFVTIDFHVIATTGSNDNLTSELILNVGGITATGTVTQTGGPGSSNATGTLAVDVSSLTGNQTVTLSFLLTNTSGPGTYTTDVFADNLLTFSTVTDDDTTIVYQVSPNGSTAYETVTRGAPFVLASDITDIGIKITETNTGAGNGVKSKIKAIGVFWK